MVMQPAGPGSPWTQVGVVSWGIGTVFQIINYLIT